MTTDFHVLPSPCPDCGQEQDGALGPNTDQKPKPGDCSICINCQAVTVFDDDMMRRAPTEAEILELPLVEISRYQRAITRNKP